MKYIAKLAALVLLTLIPLASDAQFFMFGGGNSAARDSLRRIAEADYRNMLDQLGIDEPREGRQPNSPDESKHPNYDELTANPYPFYPDPLTMQDGRKVRNAKMCTSSVVRNWSGSSRTRSMAVFLQMYRA